MESAEAAEAEQRLSEVWRGNGTVKQGNAKEWQSITLQRNSIA